MYWFNYFGFIFISGEFLNQILYHKKYSWHLVKSVLVVHKDLLANSKSYHKQLMNAHAVHLVLWNKLSTDLNDIFALQPSYQNKFAPCWIHPPSVLLFYGIHYWSFRFVFNLPLNQITKTVRKKWNNKLPVLQYSMCIICRKGKLQWTSPRFELGTLKH